MNYTYHKFLLIITCFHLLSPVVTPANLMLPRNTRSPKAIPYTCRNGVQSQNVPKLENRSNSCYLPTEDRSRQGRLLLPIQKLYLFCKLHSLRDLYDYMTVCVTD